MNKNINFLAFFKKHQKTMLHYIYSSETLQKLLKINEFIDLVIDRQFNGRYNLEIVLTRSKNMAKGKGNKPAAAAADGGKSKKVINRKKRSALERKALPKALQILFRHNTRAQNRSLLAAWQEGRKKRKED